MATVSGWIEAIIGVFMVILLVGVVMVDMNHRYNKDYDLGLVDNSTTSQLIAYESTSQTQIKGGEVDFNAINGITLKSSYGLVSDAISIVWTFLSGGFIESVINLWGLGQAGTILAFYVRILWFLSLVFALLYMLFKVVA